MGVPDLDKSKQSGEFERKINELEQRIKTLEDVLSGGSDKTVYVSSSSGGAVTTTLVVVKGIIK